MQPTGDDNTRSEPRTLWSESHCSTTELNHLLYIYDILCPWGLTQKPGDSKQLAWHGGHTKGREGRNSFLSFSECCLAALDSPLIGVLRQIVSIRQVHEVQSRTSSLTRLAHHQGNVQLMGKLHFPYNRFYVLHLSSYSRSCSVILTISLQVFVRFLASGISCSVEAATTECSLVPLSCLSHEHTAQFFKECLNLVSLWCMWYASLNCRSHKMATAQMPSNLCGSKCN